MRWLAFAAILALGAASLDVFGEACTTFHRINATLLREGDQAMYVYYRNGWESIALYPGFRGDVKDFGLCMALPSIPDFRMEKPELFAELRQFTAEKANRGGQESAGPDEKEGGHRPEIEIVKVQVSGNYKAVTLKAKAVKALTDWLDENQYQYGQEAIAVFEEYVKKDWFFVAVKIIREDDAKDFDGRLRPMGLRFKAAEPVIWTRFSALNPGGMTMNLYVVADSPIFIGEIPTTYETSRTPGGWNGRGSANYPVTRVFTARLKRAELLPHPNLSRVLDEDVWLDADPKRSQEVMKIRDRAPERFDELTAPRYEGLWMTRFMGHAPQESLAKEINFVPETAWDESGAQRLLNVLKRTSSDAAGRRKSVRCLKSSAKHAPIPSMVSELTSPEAGIRRAIAEALGAIAPKSAVPSLVDAMEKEEDFFARAAMRDALAATTGERFKLTEASKYREWWEKNK
jgi:hypothetical protein